MHVILRSSIVHYMELTGCVTMVSMGGGRDATEVAHSGLTQPLISIFAVYKPHSQALRRESDYEKT